MSVPSLPPINRIKQLKVDLDLTYNDNCIKEYYEKKDFINNKIDEEYGDVQIKTDLNKEDIPYLNKKPLPKISHSLTPSLPLEISDVVKYNKINIYSPLRTSMYK